MNTFQSTYPLSPRKFWKKFLPTIIPSFIFSVLLGVVLGFLLPLLTSGEDTMGSSFSFEAALMHSILGTIGFFVLILIAYAWYFKVYIRTYYYDGGDNFITIRKGVFAPTEIHVQYQKIQDVYVDQDILDRIMGLYDVHIASATVGSSIEAHIDGVEVAAAQGLKEFFLAKVQGASYGPQAVAAAAPGMAATQMGVPAPVQTPAFSGNISDANYPIQSVWMFKSIVGAFFTAIIFSLFVVGYFFAKLDEGTVFGLSFVPAFALVFIAYFLFHVVGIFIWKSNYQFSFMPEYIQFRTGILSISEQHLPYKSIQDVRLTQSFIDRIFGLANVTIENAAQTPVGNRGATASANVKIVGLTRDQARELTEVVKGIVLTKNSQQMGL